MMHPTQISLLKRAAIAYGIAGFCLLCFGFPFWFLHAVDEPMKGHLIAQFLFIKEDFINTFDFWNGLLGTSSILIGAISLYQAGEPTGMGKRRNLLLVSILGGIAYLLGILFPMPFAPLGAFLNALGMLLVGFGSWNVHIWTGWKRIAPLLVGFFPFIFMFPFVIIYGARPAPLIGFWGIPWIVLGIAAWQRAQELKLAQA